MTDQDVTATIAQLEARLAALEPTSSTQPPRDLDAELQQAVADENAAHTEHYRFTVEVLEPAKAAHLAAIASADATLRQVLDDNTRREKDLDAVRQRLSAVRRAMTPGGL